MKKYGAVVIVLFMLVLTVLFGFERAFANEETNFFEMMDEHGAVMLLVDPQTGKILHANNAAAAFYGFSTDELKQMNINQINTLSNAEIAQEMQNAATEQRNYFVFQHKIKTGDIRTVEVFSYPVSYQGSKVLFSIVHDITEKVLLGQQRERLQKNIIIGGSVAILLLLFLVFLLVANQKKLKKKHHEIKNFNLLRKTFIDAHKDLIYLKDENLNYVFINKSLLNFYGMPEAQIVGKDDYALGDKEFAEKRRLTDMAVLEQGKLLIDELEWNKKYYKTIKFPVQMMNGKYGVGAYIEDVTEARNLEKKREKVLYRNGLLVDILNKSFSSQQEQLDYILNHSLKLTESKYGYIYLYDEEKQEFVINSWSGQVMKECSVQHPPQTYYLEKTGLWGEVVRQRRPLIINDFAAENPLKKGYPEGHVALERFLSIPVIIDGKIVAVVGFANKEAEYDNNDIYETTVLMTGVWNAVKRREVQESLSYERNKYRQTLISIGDGVMVVDANGKIEILNHVAERLTGWSMAEAQGLPYKQVFVLSHEDGASLINDPIADVFASDMVQELGNHALLISRDGSTYHLEDSAAPIKDDTGVTMGVVLVFRDVTDKKEQRKRIEYLSFHDSLTGLYNRRFFEDAMLRLNTEENLPLAIIMGDLNGLKLTNDVFGHTFGDMLLKRLAEVMQRVCRKGDVIARWGGDEFVILLPNTNRKQAEAMIAKLKTEFAKESVNALQGSVSLGYDIKQEVNADILQVLATAEENMYAVKSLERDMIKSNAIDAILRKLHENSPRELQHSQRVSEIAERIGKALGLSEPEIRKLKQAGFMHDIGKIVMEPRFLNTNQALSKQEKNEIKRHSVVGYRILNSFDDTMDLAEAVLAHHERWDGGGYPKGLKGEGIPKAARIIALAESYERMTNTLDGANAMTKAEAIAAIRENAGKQFDPIIAEQFAIMLENTQEPL